MGKCILSNIKKNLDTIWNDTCTNILYIKEIWFLKIVIDLGSLEKAAKEVGVSISTVHEKLNVLEKFYKKKLIVEKENKTIEPTKAALQLLKLATPVLHSLGKLNVTLYKKSI